MRNNTSWVALVGVLLLPFVLTGCNLFDPMDTSLIARTDDDLRKEGNIALESGDFYHSSDIFQTLYQRNPKDPEHVRGWGESLAGQAGFKVTSMLNVLQSNVANNNLAPVLFKTLPLMKDRKTLDQAVLILMTNPEPTRSDFLTRALARLFPAVKILLEKFDTNRNGKLDINDEIDFSDNKVASWSSIYADLVIGPSPINCTLEQSFKDLANGFSGRGASWTFITPVAGHLVAGTYSPANRDTIAAVGNFVDTLKIANTYWNLQPASFAAAIRALDGVEP